jgi:two-component system capsular synthesis response regulator RcsB
MTSIAIRVIIADDHPIIIDGIRGQLELDDSIEIVGEANSFATLLELLKSTQADVIILDLTGMQIGPISMVTRLRRDYPTIAIVVFSSVIDLAPELMELGVQGYITKEELSHHMIAAIHAALGRSNYLSPTVQAYITRAQSVKRLADLSQREISVLKLLVRRLRTEEIATQLGTNPRTAQNYITALRSKTGSRQRVDLIEWYQRMFGSES